MVTGCWPFELTAADIAMIAASNKMIGVFFFKAGSPC